MNRKAKRTMLLLHLTVLLGLLLFPAYRWLSSYLPAPMRGCFLHDWFLLYCPLCGGTRAVACLMRFDLLGALRANALVVVAVPAGLILYGLAWRRLLRGEERILRIPGWLPTAGLVALILFGVLRNLLLVGFSVDPLGDLLWFWNGT